MNTHIQNVSHFKKDICPFSITKAKKKQSNVVTSRCVAIHKYTPKQAHQNPANKAPTDEGETQNEEFQTQCFEK